MNKRYVWLLKQPLLRHVKRRSYTSVAVICIGKELKSGEYSRILKRSVIDPFHLSLFNDNDKLIFFREKEGRASG